MWIFVLGLVGSALAGTDGGDGGDWLSPTNTLGADDTQISMPHHPEQIEIVDRSVRALNINPAMPLIPIPDSGGCDSGGFEDGDGDGFPIFLDCNDNNPNIYPNAPEIVANGIDEDCDGFDACRADNDNDNYGVGLIIDGSFGCNGANEAAVTGDCNDNNASIHPGANESIANGVDEDCDGFDTCYSDLDNDDFGTGLLVDGPLGCAANGTAAISGDCNDSNGSIHPFATETCNGVDDDCDNSTDEGVTNTYYDDDDNDNYGDPTQTIQACTLPSDYASNNTDCNDQNGSIHPGATETCNGVDDDCDNSTDEGVTNTYYDDDDGDTYGDSTQTTQACSVPSGYASNSTDCNDQDGSIHPGAAETCNGVDDDCDNSTDEGVTNTYYDDDDGDTYGDSTQTTQACSVPNGYASNSTDCNDAVASIHPGATETCNGIDDDCDNSTDEGLAQTWYDDGDNDGYGDVGDSTSNCAQPSGHVSNNTDCNDASSAVHPGATETCNGIDDDCDEATDEGVTNIYYDDDDGDGYGDSTQTTQACSVPSGYASNSTDCNDQIATVHPNASETCNGVDDDCDNTIDEGVKVTYYDDDDGDTYGDLTEPTQACSLPNGYATNSTDCDDTAGSIHPGANEVCNNLDDDCDDVIDEGVTNETYYLDGDGDGFGGATNVIDCAPPSGYVLLGGDCDDGLATVNPNANETCNGVDDNCVGGIDEGVTNTYYDDSDGDNFGDPGDSTQACSTPAGHVTNSTDCDDAVGTTFPGANETCNGIDDDCDGSTDEGASNANTYYRDFDGDSYGTPSTTSDACSAPAGYVTSSADCDDTDPGISPAATETCNGIDDDCDGTTDVGADNATPWYADDDADGYGAGSSTQACNQPTGRVADNTDCDDTRAGAFPGATEQCNNLDDDCDGAIDNGTQDQPYFADNDGDGAGDPNDSVLACDAPSGFVLDDSDCDDTAATINPSASESCNGTDDDCDGAVDEDPTDGTSFWLDSDGDGHGATSNEVIECSAPAGYVALGDDCNDTEPAAWIGHEETCDGIDNDCDGLLDPPTSTDAFISYRDADSDDFGNPNESLSGCDLLPGYVLDDTDCDDLNAAVNPEQDEICDLLDNDCDGGIDNDAIDAFPAWIDADLDTFGDTDSPVLICSLIAGFADNGADCDDDEATTNPDAYDQCDDQIDNDCDGAVDENANIVTWYVDADGDNYGLASDTIEACAAPVGYAQLAGDCDDDESQLNPGVNEFCDGIDNNCNGTIDDFPVDGILAYEDLDQDGFGDPLYPVVVCDISLFATNAGDCDDLNLGVSPIQLELCDGIDNDCNGVADDNPPNDGALFYQDNDGDGQGVQALFLVSCVHPVGYVIDYGDCDDTQPTVYFGANEVCDGIDNDCDGAVDDDDSYVDPASATTWWLDGDSDGYGPEGVDPDLACLPPEGAAVLGDDCDDDDPLANPGATEIPGDGIDNDCVGGDPDPSIDSDSDGIPDYLEEELGGDPFSTDSDGDGISDTIEGTGDSDGDGLADFVDDDDDDDGLLSSIEGGDDFDGDGIPNNLDLDSDNDGVPDALEHGDQDGDGVLDALDAGGTTRTAPPDEDAEYGFGCGCNEGGSPAPWALLMMLPLLARRRSA